MEKLCPFCNVPPADLLLQNDLCYARFDRYPVAEGHLLIIPFRHIASVFDLTERERNAALELLWKAKDYLEAAFHPAGYNIGANAGQVAGQTIMHVHIHLIPRYTGDMENPEGGVRGVIPEKRIYRRA
jgi:diadenosine tetraphosphate (Ap4A) HIT family hydrolase